MIETPCWIWPGRLRKQDGRALSGREYAYRLVYEAARGPIPEGMILHHECENPACVNPDHIEIKTQGEHLTGHGLPGDWGQADKTRCPNGHPYDGENTYTYARKNGSVERHCKLCRQATKRRYRERLKQNGQST